jgi:spore germination protein GerM
VSRSRPGAVGALVALAVALCACGVPTSGAPRALSKGDVPRLPPTSTTTTSPTANLPFTVVWLDAANNPSPQTLYAPRQSDRLANALDTLLEGPPNNQFTAIPPGTHLNQVTPNPSGVTPPAPDNPVVVNVSSDFTESGGIDQVLAVEQVVFTIACNLTPATRVSVSFEVDGTPLPVPLLSGSPVARPVTPADYKFSASDCTPAS